MIVFFLFVFSFLFSQNQLVDGVIAVVGKEAVLFSDVKDEADLFAQEKKIKNTSPLYESLFRSVLDKKINNKVILTFAQQDSTLVVSYDEIKQILNDRIGFYIQKFGSVEAFEVAVGTSVAQMKEKNWKTIEEELLIEKYRMKNFRNISITKHDVFTFFEEYKDSLPLSFSSGSYSVLQKKIKPSLKNKNLFLQESKKLIDSLRNGSLDFTKTVLSRSIDPSAINNEGVLVSLRGELVPEYEKAAYSLGLGEISSLTESPFGYHIIRLLEKKGEKIKTQHLLLSLKTEEEDIGFVFTYLDSIKTKTENDPGVFDSLCIASSSGFSGFYEKKGFLNMPSFVEAFVETGNNYSFSEIIKEGDFFTLVFKYSFNPSTEKTLKNSWFELESLALNKKRFDEFEKWITDKKEKMYIYIKEF